MAQTFVVFLIENDSYFRMMTHFMLDGVQNESLNWIERAILDQFSGFFAALNGILMAYGIIQAGITPWFFI